MQYNTMGLVTVPAKIENVCDLYLVSKGLIPEEQVHRIEVTDALVDTCFTYVAMPLKLIRQLGFDEPTGMYQAQTAAGLFARPLFGPVRLTVLNRLCSIDIAEVPDDWPVIIGKIPLQILDLVVDPQGQCLTGNPRHGGQQIIEMY